MKQSFILLISMLLIQVSLGQDYDPEITSDKFKIDKSEAFGFGSELPYEKTVVEKSLFRFLRNIGRTETVGNYFMTRISQVTDSIESEKMVFARVYERRDSSRVIFGLDTVGMESDGQQDHMDDLRNMLKNFDNQVHIEDLESQVKEAEKAVNVKNRSVQKLVNESIALERRLQFNEAEKARLENALGKNTEEKEVFLEKMEINRKVQDLAKEDLKKVETRMIQLREKLNSFRSKSN